jgi:hypothetical protein
VITAAAGTISRGKYTYCCAEAFGEVSRLLLAIMLSEQLLSAVEKNCQGNIAANTKIA